MTQKKYLLKNGLDFGSMDLYGIGFANVRMSTSSNDYTYKYDYN